MRGFLKVINTIWKNLQIVNCKQFGAWNRTQYWLVLWDLWRFPALYCVYVCVYVPLGYVYRRRPSSAKRSWDQGQTSFLACQSFSAGRFSNGFLPLWSEDRNTAGRQESEGMDMVYLGVLVFLPSFPDFHQFRLLWEFLSPFQFHLWGNLALCSFIFPPSIPISFSVCLSLSLSLSLPPSPYPSLFLVILYTGNGQATPSYLTILLKHYFYHH